MAQDLEAKSSTLFPSTDKSFDHSLTVRFHEVDAARIVFFGRIYEYCHAAFEQMLAGAGTSLDAILVGESWGMPLVHCEADFCAPMFLGENLKVELRVERVGGSSITFAYRIVGADKKLRATAKLVHAFADLKRFVPCKTPDMIPEVLRKMGLIE